MSEPAPDMLSHAQAGRRSPVRLVVGLGNPILGDDGVGWKVAERIAQRLEPEAPLENPPVCVEYASAGGLSLMERLVGCSQVVLIDSIVTGTRPPGEVMKFDLAALPRLARSYTASVHDVSLQQALNMARLMGAPLPQRVDVVAVEIVPAYEFSDQLSGPVQSAVPLAEYVVWNILFEEACHDLS